MWEPIISRCAFLSRINHLIENKEELTNAQIKKMTYFASRFGEDGKRKLLSLTWHSNISAELINNLWEEVHNEEYSEPAMCYNLCGKDNLCKAIKAVNRTDPLELPVNYNTIFNESMAANYFCRYYSDIVLYHLGTSRFYEYVDGCWQQMSEDKLGMILERMLVSIYPKETIVNSGIEALIKRLKKVEQLFFAGEFNDDRSILNFKNGLFDLNSLELIPHTPEYKSSVQFPVEYDPSADCLLFKEKISEIFEEEQEVVDYFLQWMMYSLMSTYEFQKALLLLGKGGNGKSVLTDVWTALLGKQNTSNQELGDLSSDRNYSVFQLIGKYANFSREVSSLEKDSHIFKMLTGNDMMPARQIYGKPVDFRNKARLIISANTLPSFKTLDQAILRRFEIIKFNKRFDQNADTLLSQKLIKELPGILNLILEQYSEIVNPDGSIYFESPGAVSGNLQLFSQGSDSVTEFVTEACEVTTQNDVEYATLLSVLYQSYLDWCRDSAGEQPKSKKIFRAEIEHLYNCSTYMVTSVNAVSNKLHKNSNWIIGLRLNEPIEEAEAIAEPLRRKLGL